MRDTVQPALPEDEWLSYADYVKRSPSAGRLHSADHTNKLDPVNSAIPDSADTRSEHCITELLFFFESPGSLTASVSRAAVHGTLSLGATYVSALDSTARGETSMHDTFVGREVSSTPKCCYLAHKTDN